MNRYVIMVDAGYLLRQALEIVSGRASKRRTDLEISDPRGLVALLVEKAKLTLALENKELLRVYWYDGVNPGGFTDQQRSLVEVDDVQFRAGTINSAKQQKGVDSLIVTDLIELTSHHAVCDAILITGDSDLAVGIELAQRRGVRIAVLGVEDLSVGVAHHQSFEITSRADRVGRIGAQELTGLVRYAPVAPQSQTAQPARRAPDISPPTAPNFAPIRIRPSVVSEQDRTSIERAVHTFVAERGEDLHAALDSATNRIESATDRALIHHVFQHLAQGALSNEQKIWARAVFRAALNTRGPQSPADP